MDAPLAAKSGHQGTAMALAPLAHVLFSRILRFDPSDPNWPDRDRFVLSAGHASILQYAVLHLAGFAVSLDDIRAFRQWGSATPGHPEAGHTPGVEVTTGPLGQGFANAVGMAITEAHLRERFGREVMDHDTWVVAGDGCLMEGISHEAASLAGHLALDRLVCVFDDNRITIDGPTSLTCSDDVAARFRAYRWNVIEAGDLGDDLDAIEAVLLSAREHRGAPTLVVLRTHIGAPSPDLTDAHEAHGNPFDAAKVAATKAVMGVPDEPFWVPDALDDAYAAHCAERGATLRSEWSERARLHPDFLANWSGQPTTSWEDELPVFTTDDSPATRQSFQKILEASLPRVPTLLVGAADLTGNTGAKLSGAAAMTPDDHSGSQIFYGIREHAMGAAMVGMALHGGVIPVGGTFFVFADYMRPAIRLAALSRARCVFVFSHDSVGVGEDGPTHQPVEHLASLRAIPGLQVIRPADGNETRRAWIEALGHDGPTALVLTRQATPTVTDGSAVDNGAGIVRDADAPELVVVGTGSEVAVALAAADILSAEGVSCRVVSMPSWDRLEAAPDAHREAVFPTGVPRLSVEAASTFGWRRWVDDSVGIDRFGASAPGGEVMSRLGITAEAVADRARTLLAGR
jgi:transketolase